MKRIFVIILLCFDLFSCKKAEQKSINASYDFASLDVQYSMPKELNEISGINLLNDSLIVAHNDEKGILYFYNLKNETIEKELKFAKKGDFEDLAINDSTVYVLESNGKIHQIDNFLKEPKITFHTTSLSQKDDAEGLCLNVDKKSLLITTKGKNHSKIMSFSLLDNTIEKVIFHLDKKVLKEKFKVENKFLPSALAFHPISKNLFIVSSVAKAIIEIDSNHNIIAVYNVNFTHFGQPEGIFFDTKGNLFISNEANNGKKATILKYNYKP